MTDPDPDPLAWQLGLQGSVTTGERPGWGGGHAVGSGRLVADRR